MKRAFGGFLLAGAVVLALPASGWGQEAEVRSFCFNGAPPPRCSAFLVVEMQGVLNLVSSTRTVRWFSERTVEETPFEDQLQWELGLMHNLGERWALGGVARLGPGSTGALTGLAARGRRWMANGMAVDLSAGATFLGLSTPGRWGRQAGLLADARLNLNDDAYAGLRFEFLPITAHSGPGGAYDPGGNQHALSLLLGVGSEWAVGGSAALAVGLLALAAAVDWD